MSLPTDRRRSLPGFAYAVLLAASLFAEGRRAGWSALLWRDTLNDNDDVRKCLSNLGCNFNGIASSVPPFVNPSGWLHMRAALQAAGIDADGTHRLILVANAVAFVLVARAAERLGGRLAAVIAAVVSIAWFVPHDVRDDVLFNSAPMRVIGALFLSTLIDAAEEPTVRRFVLAALCGAVMTSVYVSSAPAVLSVAFLAFRAPAHRWRLALVSIGVFGALAWITTPGGWVMNMRAVLGGLTSGTHGSPGIGVPESATMVLLAIGIAVLWGVSSVALPGLRRALDVPVLAAIPSLALFSCAVKFAGIRGDEKYISHTGPALAVAVALPIAFAARSLRRWRLVPITLGVLAVPLLAFRVPAGQRSELTLADIRATTSVLTGRGWGWRKALSSLQTPYLEALPFARGLLPDRPPSDDATNATLLKVPHANLPSPLPPGWRVVKADGPFDTVIVFSSSRLNWRSFRVCTLKPTGEEECVESGRTPNGNPDVDPAEVAGIPVATAEHPVTIRLHVPILPSTGGLADRISMSNWPGECHGRIVGTGDPAQLMLDSTSATPEVEFEWTLGGPGCRNFRQFPPFVLEGDVNTVRVIEGVFQRGRP